MAAVSFTIIHFHEPTIVYEIIMVVVLQNNISRVIFKASTVWHPED